MNDEGGETGSMGDPETRNGESSKGSNDTEKVNRIDKETAIQVISWHLI